MSVGKQERKLTWKEAIDWAIREYRVDLDALREYDLKAAKKLAKA